MLYICEELANWRNSKKLLPYDFLKHKTVGLLEGNTNSEAEMKIAATESPMYLKKRL